MSTETALHNLLSSDINISQGEITQGSRSHTYIRDVLRRKSDSDTGFPWLLDGDFLSGSYARGTKLKPLNDIDVMMVLDGTGFHVLEYGRVLNLEVEGSGIEGNPLLTQLQPNSLLSSHTVMDHFSSALKQMHPNSTIRADRQAVNVRFDSYNLGIDIVPCFHLMPRDGTRDYYYIPDASGGWKSTNPKIDAEISENLQARHNRLMKKLVRLIKFWNEVSNTRRLKSYHLETMVWNIFDVRPAMTTSLEDGLLYFFSHVDTHLSSSCPDKTLLGGPVDTYLLLHDRNLTRTKIVETLRVLLDAYVDNPSLQAQQQAWQTIFNGNLDI